MGDLSYQKRKARGRVPAELGAGGYSVHRWRIRAESRGSQVKLMWALDIIHRWRRAVRNGTPVSEVQYPQHPYEGKMRWREPWEGAWDGQQDLSTAAGRAGRGDRR